MTSLFVGNLSKNVDMIKFNKLFKKYGECHIEIKIKKGPYAFVEYSNHEDAKKAVKELNRTNLQGANGTSIIRIEISKKKKGEGEDLRSQSLSDLSVHGEKTKQKTYEENGKYQIKKNICFICKLSGHIAKECIITKEMCYECGEKGHIAKECKEKVREAKTLTYNRVKAIRSQQSEYKSITPSVRINNVLAFLSLKEKEEL